MTKVRTKRKILAMVLSVVLVLILLPGMGFTASAAGAESIYLGGIKLNNGMYLANGAAEGSYTAPESGGYAYFADGVLRLNNFRYEGNSLAYPNSGWYAALYSVGDLTITLAGDNSIKCGGNSYANGIWLPNDFDLTINGNGSLYVNSVGPFDIDGGEVVITGDAEVVAHASGGAGLNGINCSSFTFNGKKLTVITENSANPSLARGILAGSIEFSGGTTAISSTGIPLCGTVNIRGADTVVACACSTGEDANTSTLIGGTMTLHDGLELISPAGAEVVKHPGYNGFWILKTADDRYTRSFIAGPTVAAKSVMAGTDHLKGAQLSNIYFGRYQQSLIGETEPETGTEGVDWVYQHNQHYSMQDSYYSIDPIQWRVLFNADGKLLVLSDTAIDKMSYHGDPEEITYERSGIRSWLNGYDSLENDEYSSGSDNGGTDYTNDNFIDAAFCEKEQNVIRQTEVINSVFEGIAEFAPNPHHIDVPGGNDTKDKIFLLSLSDVMNPLHGFVYSLNATDRRKAIVSDYTASGGTLAFIGVNFVGASSLSYYLRTPGDSSQLAVIVMDGGNVDVGGGAIASNITDIRPALHIAPEKIILTSAAVGGKREVVGGIAEIDDYNGKDWKLTAYDESRSDFSATFSQSGTTLNVSYSGAKTGENEYISAIAKSKNGQITHYGRLAEVTAASGSVAVDISLLDSVGSLYVFNEQINGDYETDYASKLIPFAMGEPERISESGNEYDGYYEIANAENLLWFAQQVNSGNAAIKGVMTADIDLSGINWTPIGGAENKFSGIFDGGGYSISNVEMEARSNYYGLFGYISGATVQNLSVDGAMTISCTESDKFHLGTIGYADGTSIISGIKSSLDITMTEVDAQNQIGGVVGRADGDTTISKCSYSGTIELGGATADCVGGIVSYTVAGDKIDISDCAFYGEIHSECETAFSVGGIMGYYNGDTTNGENISIKNCLSAGTITCAQTAAAGALVGVLKNIAAQNAGNFNNNYYCSSLADIGDKPGVITGVATAVDETQLASGMVAYLLGDNWGQTIGTDKHPVIDGEAVYKYRAVYTNGTMEITEFEILSYGASDTKATAVVQIPTEGEYTLIFADYDKNGRLSIVDALTQNFEVGITTVESSSNITLAVGDRIMLWSDVVDMKPLCQAVTLSLPAQYVSGTGGHTRELANNLFDDDVNTKWCSSLSSHGEEPTVIFKYEYPVCMERYTLTTANDTAQSPERNWKEWTLYGGDSEDGEWTQIHKVSDALLPEENWTESDPFIIKNNIARYQYYKLVVNRIGDGDTQQMSEFSAIVK